MPIGVPPFIHPVYSKEEFQADCKSSDWLVVAGPYTLPGEGELVRKAVWPFERDRIDFRLVSENKWGTVVNLFRRKPLKLRCLP